MPWWQLSSWPEASEIHIIRACSSSGQTGISYWTYLRQGLAISFLPPGFFWGAKNLALRNILWNTSYAAKVIICPLLLMCCSCTMFDLNNFTVLFFNLFSTRTQKTELQTLIPISPKSLNWKMFSQQKPRSKTATIDPRTLYIFAFTKITRTLQIVAIPNFEPTIWIQSKKFYQNCKLLLSFWELKLDGNWCDMMPIAA